MLTRDEIERADKLLRQGVDLDRAMMRKLVDHALANRPPRKHLDGCGWLRGAGCDCEDATGPLDLAVKQLLVDPNAAPHVPAFTFTCWKCSPAGWVSAPYPTPESRDSGAELHVRETHPEAAP